MQQYILKNRNWNRFFFLRTEPEPKPRKSLRSLYGYILSINVLRIEVSLEEKYSPGLYPSVVPERSNEKKKKNYSRIRMVSSEHYRFGCQQSNYNNDSFVGLSRANVLKSSTTRSENYYHANYNVTSFCLLQCIAALYYRRRVLIFFL